MSGRIRTLKPEWLEDELLQESSSDARVLSAALILLADDHGNGRGGEKYLAGAVFPGQPTKVLRDALARLVAIRFCRTYQVDGQTYFAIRNWAKHQKVDKPGKPKVPEAPASAPESLANSPEASGNSSTVLAPRAGPLPSLPDPDPGTGPDPDPSRGSGGDGGGWTSGVDVGDPAEDRDTVVPLDLAERVDQAGIPEQFATTYGVPPEAVRWHVGETLTYWSIGGGSGRRKRNWLQVVRTRLHELGKAKRLGEWPDPSKALVPVGGARGPLRAGSAEARTQAQLERVARLQAEEELEASGS